MSAQPNEPAETVSNRSKAIAIVREPKAGCEIVTVIGEADLSAAAELDDAIAQAGAGGMRVVVDLRLATYIDSTTLTTLIRANKAFPGKFSVVVPKDGMVRRVFAITSLFDVLHVVETPDDLLLKGLKAV